VDDDFLVAAGTASMLEELGCEVLQADSASSALDVLRGHPEVELVITDQAMPDMSGIELAREIHRVRPGLPIILATGYSNLASFEGPQLPLLNKPYDSSQLIQLMSSLLPGDRATA